MGDRREGGEARASFAARWAAYTIDLALLAPLVLLAALPLLRRAAAAVSGFEAAVAAALERAFDSGATRLVALAAALRADPPFRSAALEAASALLGALAGLGVLCAIAMALWFIGFERSRWQATPGKRLMRIRVEAAAGGRAAPWRIALRFVAAAPSWLVLHLGHAMAGWREDGRALHDLVAGTRVTASGALPAWARAWLALQALAFAALLAWVLASLVAALFVLGL